MSDAPEQKHAGQKSPALPEVRSDAGNGQGEDKAVSRPLYQRKRVIIPLVIALLLGVFAYWYYSTNIRGYDATDDAFIDGNRVSVSAKMLGRIITLTVDEGDTVHQGDLIVKLDDADLRAQEAQAVAALEDARQGIELTEANYRRTQNDFQRTETQYRTRAVSREQFEHTRSALATARTQQKIAGSRVATADAQLNVIRTELRNTAIEAPMTGIVAKRFALPGDVVQPGQPILSVYDLSSVWVTANFEETKLRTLHIGDPVEISVDAYPDRALTGHVAQFGAATASQFSLIPPNNASGNFTKVTQRVPVKILIDPPGANRQDGHSLLPGMSVEVKVKVK